MGNKVWIHQIKSQLAACRQDGQSVLDYYGHLCILWEELQIYRPIPVCTCGASLEIVKDIDEGKVHNGTR